jgi:uncharacterized protein (TIGR00255 family)
MAFSGMTGFARTSGEADWGTWFWEARSVNGRGLDIRLNLPSGLDGLEPALRKAIRSSFTRGSVQVALRIDMTGAESVRINQDVLQTLMAAYQETAGDIATGPALATLMGVKGVVESESRALRDLNEIEGAVASLIETGLTAITELQGARQQEGVEVQAMLAGHLSEMAKLTAQARQFAVEQQGSIALKYRTRIAEFDTEGAVSDERLATEIAVLAAKADVTEELDRLAAHIERGHGLISGTEAVGRDLGFLAQELNRETNTLCSKAAFLDLTNTGLALKSIVDQFKEQAANVE